MHHLIYYTVQIIFCDTIRVDFLSHNPTDKTRASIRTIGWQTHDVGIAYTYLEQAHVEEELEYGVDGDVEVDIHGHTTRPHILALLERVNLLSTNHSKDEEHIGRKRYHL